MCYYSIGLSNLLSLTTGHFSSASYHSSKLPMKNATLAHSSARLL